MPTPYLDHDPTRLEIKAHKLNSICVDCVLQGTTCPGTTCQVWTGCVRKPWNPTAQLDAIGATSRHNINPAGLMQAVAATRKASTNDLVSILYSETADAIKVNPRKPGEPLRTPSTYQYITTTSRPMTAAEILGEIDSTIDLMQDLPF